MRNMPAFLRSTLFLVALLFLTPFHSTAQDEEGFVSLFNGKDLTGWEGEARLWSVEDGAITGRNPEDQPVEHNTFLIWRGGTVEDFVLRFKYRIFNGNSGLQYRSKELPDFVVGGYQADFEAGTRYSGILYEERGRGILANRGQKTVVGDDGKPEVVGSVGVSEEIQKSIKAEDWNDYEISAVGNHIVHKINGHVTVDVTDNDHDTRARSGIVALQVHRGPPMKVQAKDIRLKKIENRRSAQREGGNERGVGFEAAVKDLENFEVAEGLEATVFAAEPMVVNPTNMDIDEKGRIWVTEGVNYRSSFKPWGTIREKGDRIVILEDTDLDGAADSEKVFYQGEDINAALGICVLGNKVIVSCSPNIFLFTDTDGDDKADKKEVIFSGIEGVDHDHGVHAFTFGPDGKLYFNMGNSGAQLKTPDGKEFIVDFAGNKINGSRNPYQQGLVLRCNPDFTEVETLAWNFRNNYEVAVDSFGTLWQSDNDDDGNKAVRINYVMRYGNYGYNDEMTGEGWRAKRTNMEEEIPQQHWHQNDPGVVPNLLVTGAGSPTGIIVYEGRLLPQVFRRQIIHCDAGPNVVRSYITSKDGAGYKVKDVVNVLKSSDSWFRPSDVCVAPDGAIYVADWNDPGVGGHNMGDREPGAMRGRIYRVAPPLHQASKPELNLDGVRGCMVALRSPNLATRYLGWTKLHEMQGKAEQALLRVYKGKNQRMRARAVQLLTRIEGREKMYTDWAVMDENPDIQIAGLRIARMKGDDLIPYVRELAYEPKSTKAVLRECALALRHNDSSQAPELWAQLASRHDGEDRWYVEALGIAADKQHDAYFKAWLDKVGEKWNTKAGRDIIWRSRSKLAPGYLVKLIKDETIEKSERDRYFRALDFITGPEKEAALLELLTATSSQ